MKHTNKYRYKLKGNWLDDYIYLNYTKEGRIILTSKTVYCETTKEEFTEEEFLKLSEEFGFEPTAFEREASTIEIEKLDIIKQLEDLMCHCEEMRKDGDAPWGDDVIALDYAIRVLKEQEE